MRPVLLVIAGPNGAGKTTVAALLRTDRDSPQAVLQAVNWVDARREQLLAARQDIALETVCSSSGKLDFLHRSKTLG